MSTAPSERRSLPRRNRRVAVLLVGFVSVAMPASAAVAPGGARSVPVVVSASPVLPAPHTESQALVQAVVTASPRRPHAALVVADDVSADNGVHYGWTSDSGRTWQARILRGVTSASGGPWDSAGFSSASTGVGTEAYIATRVQRDDCETGLIIARAADGRHFHQTRTVQRSDDCAVFIAKPWVTVDASQGSPWRGRVYLSWTTYHRDAEQSVIAAEEFIVHSDDHGRTWSSPLSLSPSDEFRNFNSVVTQPDGAVTVSYSSFDENTTNDYGLLARTSTDGGLTFGPEILIDTELIGFTGNADTRCCMQVLAVDPATGRLHLVVQDTRLRDDDLNDVFLYRSDDGTHWRRPVVVNAGDQDSPYERYSPSVGAYGGTVYVVWTLRGVPGGTLSDTIRQQATVSHDGGRSFGPPRFVGPPGDGRYSASAGDFAPRFQSDYNTTAVVPGRAYTAWPRPSAAAVVEPNQFTWVATLKNRSHGW